LTHVRSTTHQLDDIEVAITWIGQAPAGAHFQAVKGLLTGKVRF
jgi:hypothetical protein